MKATIIIIGGIVLSSGIFFGFKLSKPSQAEFRVQYTVECSACDIAYRDEEGRSIRKEGIKGNWDYAYTGKAGHYAFISALAHENDSPASVKISIDGKVKDADSSESKLAAANAAQILN